MALSKDQVDYIIKGFISRLMHEIPIREVILFGSYARETQRIIAILIWQSFPTGLREKRALKVCNTSPVWLLDTTRS